MNLGKSSSGQVLASFLAALAWLSVTARGDDEPTPIEPEPVALGRPVDYANDVAPILEANCVACHNAGVEEGELSLEGIAGMLEGGDRGPAVVPGKPDESLLLAVAAHRREPVMPPPDNDVEAKPLTPRELGVIRQWIIEGATKGAGTAGPVISWRSLPRHYKAIHGVALSSEGRFAAVGRGNQLEVYDLTVEEPGSRLVDPGLSKLDGGQGLLYPEGAADRDLVQAVAFAPDGMLLASGGYRAVKLWRRVGLGSRTPLTSTGVAAFALSSDGNHVAAAVGHEVRLIGLGDGEVTSTWPAAGEISALAFSGDGESVAATVADNTLVTWRLADGIAGTARPFSSSATAVAAVGERIVTAHKDGVLRVWAEEGQPERELKGHSGPVRDVAPIAGRPAAVLSAGDDGTVRLWDAATGELRRSMTHGNPATGVAASPGGDVVVSCGRGGTIKFWNAGDGKTVAEFSGSIALRRLESEALEAVEWRKQLAAVAEGHLKEAQESLKDREEISRKAADARAAAEQRLVEARKAEGEAIAAAATASEQAGAKPEEAALKAGAEAAAKAAESATAKRLETEDSWGSSERSVGLAEQAVALAQARLADRSGRKEAADGAVADATNALQAASEAAGRPVVATNVAFAPDGRRVAVAYEDGTVQTLSSAGKPLDAVRASEAIVREVAWTAGGEQVLVMSEGAVGKVELGEKWEYAATLGPPPDAPLDLSRSAFADRVLSLSFSPDGKLLAAGGGTPSRGGELSLWEVDSRTQIRTFADAHSDTVQAVAFSRDGRVLASAAADKFAKTFDVEGGSLLRSLEGHTDHALGVTVQSDGTTVTTAAADGTVKVWDAETGEQRRTITGHAKQVTAVRYAGMTEQVVTASGDRTVRLFRTSDGRQLRSFEGPVDYVHGLDVSDDGLIAAAGGEEGVLFVWDVKSGKLIRRLEPPQGDPPATAAK